MAYIFYYVRGRKKKNVEKWYEGQGNGLFFSYSFGVIINSTLAIDEGLGQQRQYLVHIQMYILQIQQPHLILFAISWREK
jgi:hypothetical protein